MRLWQNLCPCFPNCDADYLSQLNNYLAQQLQLQLSLLALILHILKTVWWVQHPSRHHWIWIWVKGGDYSGSTPLEHLVPYNLLFINHFPRRKLIFIQRSHCPLTYLTPSTSLFYWNFTYLDFLLMRCSLLLFRPHFQWWRHEHHPSLPPGEWLRL